MQTRFFTENEFKRLRVIYLLRQAQFSISAIYRALRLLDSGQGRDALDFLESPDLSSIFTSGDHVLEVLKITHAKAINLIDFLQFIQI